MSFSFSPSPTPFILSIKLLYGLMLYLIFGTKRASSRLNENSFHSLLLLSPALHLKQFIYCDHLERELYKFDFSVDIQFLRFDDLRRSLLQTERQTRQIRITAGTRRGGSPSNAIISRPGLYAVVFGNRYLSGNRHEVRINLSEVGGRGVRVEGFAFETTRRIGIRRFLKNGGITIRFFFFNGHDAYG